MRVTDHFVAQDSSGKFFVAYLEYIDIDKRRRTCGSKHYAEKVNAEDALHRMISDAKLNKFQPFTY